MQPVSHDKLVGLVRAAQAGNASAREQLLRWLRPLLCQWVRPLCNSAVLEDAVQETLFQVFHKLNQLRRPEAFVGWAHTIARNTARREQRAWKKKLRAEQELQPHRPDDAASLSEMAAQEEELLLLAQAVASLAEPFRRTVEDFLAGVSIKEISLKHGCPVGTVKRRLHTARRRLGKWLEAKLAA